MRPVVVISRIFVLFFAVSLFGLASASACGTGKLLYQDTFKTLDPSWNFDATDSERSLGPDGLSYTFKPHEYVGLLNQAGIYHDYEICGTFQTKAPANGWAYLGVQFWGADDDNYYEADINPVQGSFSVYRSADKKSLTPVGNTNSDAINKGTDVTNEVSITVVGNKATFVINGKKVIEFTGQPPSGGSLIGFGFGTDKGDSGPTTMTLKDIEVREPSAPPTAAAAPAMAPAAPSAPASPAAPSTPASAMAPNAPASPAPTSPAMSTDK
jgi:hypothetical protein